MKLAPLLVQYLITHKRLDLPGIGSFLLYGPAYPEPEQYKQDKQAALENVSFENNTSVKISPDLIQFIADQTGKIKALVSADLESYLGLAQQFLNIGNPFLFEGIGILEKLKSGNYVLKPVTGTHEKTKEYAPAEKQDSPESGEFRNDYKKIFYSGKGKIKLGNPIVIILVIAGLGLAVWGGYLVYKKTGKNKLASTERNEKNNDKVNINDSVLHQKDSVVDSKQQLSPPITGSFRFVLEDANEKRAFERFAKLKTFQWPVQMATKDSVFYSLFVVLPASAADTSRILDSLSTLNGRRVYIEQ